MMKKINKKKQTGQSMAEYIVVLMGLMGITMSFAYIAADPTYDDYDIDFIGIDNAMLEGGDFWYEEHIDQTSMVEAINIHEKNFKRNMMAP